MKNIRKIIVFSFFIIFCVILIINLDDSENSENNEIFHITLADQQLYQNGQFEDQFDIESGKYKIIFVPNGSSPRILTITLVGNSFEFMEDFELEGIIQETGISKYYTWKYLGINEFQINQNDILMIQVNPHGDIKGSVSIDIIKKEE